MLGEPSGYVTVVRRCAECPEWFRQWRQLAIHRAVKHGTGSYMTTSTPQPIHFANTFKCSKCGSRFPKKFLRDAHVKMDHIEVSEESRAVAAYRARWLAARIAHRNHGIRDDVHERFMRVVDAAYAKPIPADSLFDGAAT